MYNPTIGKKKLPSKSQINFIKQEKVKGGTANNIKVLLILLGIVAAIAFVYFGIIQRYQKLNKKEADLVASNQQLEEVKQKVEDYEEKLKEYIRFSFEYLTVDEAAYADRKALLDKIEERVMPTGAVTKLQLSGNEAQIIVFNITMDEASQVMAELCDEEIVKSVFVSNANNEQAYEDVQVPVVQMKITFKKPKDENETKSDDTLLIMDNEETESETGAEETQTENEETQSEETQAEETSAEGETENPEETAADAVENTEVPPETEPEVLDAVEGGNNA